MRIAERKLGFCVNHFLENFGPFTQSAVKDGVLICIESKDKNAYAIIDRERRQHLEF